jgi:hypothetical protein
MGSHLRFDAAPGGQEKICLGRCSVYPPDAIGDLAAHCSAAVPFNLAAAAQILARSTKSRMIQELAYAGDPGQVRVDACALNFDKSGALIEHLRASLPRSEAIPIPIASAAAPRMSVAERMAKARAARGKVGATQLARL